MQLKVGQIVEGTVKSLTKFGAFVALDANTTGLVHISEIAYTYVSQIEEHLSVGQQVKVMVIGMENGKINLSIKRTQSRENAPRARQGAPQRAQGTQQWQQGAPQRPQAAAQEAAQTGAPAQKSFDDMLRQFMTESDSKMSSIRAYSDHKTKTRRR